MKNIQLFILIIIFGLCVQISECGSNKTLKFNNDGTYKILQLTDLHYGENIFKDLLNVALQTYLINVTNPDYVALTGDMVSGYGWIEPLDTYRSFYQRNWAKYTLPIIRAKKEYSIILGNHDCEANLNRTEVMDFDSKQSQYSHSKKSPKGVSEGSNYFIPIQSAHSDKIISIMWYLDTHREGCLEVTYGWGCIYPDQIEWFDAEIKKIQEKQPNDEILHIVFIHIPLPEYINLYNEGWVYGRRAEGVGCPTKNTGFFQSLKKYKIRAVFCGHDHNNDYGGFYQGVELVYGRKSGFGGYGPPEDIKRGGRILTLIEQYDEFKQTSHVEFSHKIIQSNGEYIENGEATKRHDPIGKCNGAELFDRQSKDTE